MFAANRASVATPSCSVCEHVRPYPFGARVVPAKSRWSPRQLSGLPLWIYQACGGPDITSDQARRQLTPTFSNDGLNRRTGEFWLDSGQIVNSITYQDSMG